MVTQQTTKPPRIFPTRLSKYFRLRLNNTTPVRSQKYTNTVGKSIYVLFDCLQKKVRIEKKLQKEKQIPESYGIFMSRRGIPSVNQLWALFDYFESLTYPSCEPKFMVKGGGRFSVNRNWERFTKSYKKVLFFQYSEETHFTQNANERQTLKKFLSIMFSITSVFGHAIAKKGPIFSMQKAYFQQR